jgi:AcrR family transcriptional regulator
MPRVTEEYLTARRARILDAAITCFARDGFQRATIPDIAAEAGLSAGAIYRYFSGKEDVVEAIAEAHRTPAPGVLEAMAAQPDLAAAFSELITASFGRLDEADEQRWRRITVQLWGEALRDERVMRIVRTGRDEPLEQIAKLVRRAQADGAIRTDVDPLAAARMCASLFYGLVLQLASDPTVDVDRYVEAVRITLDAVLRTPATHAPDGRFDADRTFDELVTEAERAPLGGWDFSWLAGRATEQRPSWGYSRLLAERMENARSALDIETGGGEVLAGLPHIASLTVATEGWAPMIPAASRTLGARGVRLVHVDPAAPLPFGDDAFELVSSRHPTTTSWPDVHRVLKPRGTFLTQQVGSSSVDKLGSLFRGPATGRRSLDTAHAEATAAGLDVVRAEEEFPEVVFYDIGAVVYFLRLVVWIVPNFTVNAYRAELEALHHRIRSDGAFRARAHRFLIQARKPT